MYTKNGIRKIYCLIPSYDIGLIIEKATNINRVKKIL